MARLRLGILKALDKYARDSRRLNDKSLSKIVLVITGDILENATTANAALAAELLPAFVSAIGATHCVVARGNHDTRRLWGTFWRNTQFDVLLGEARVLHDQPLLLEDYGLHIIPIDSTRSGRGAMGRVDEEEFRKFNDACVAAEQRLGPAACASLLRIVAVHHHPLPIADAEANVIPGTRIPEEPLLRFEGSGRFLHACHAYDVDVVLHGHTHVQALMNFAAFSSPPGKTTVAWRNTAVIAAPSSTGEDCKPGFNMLIRRAFGSMVEVRLVKIEGDPTSTHIDCMRDVEGRPPTVPIEEQRSRDDLLHLSARLCHVAELDDDALLELLGELLQEVFRLARSEQLGSFAGAVRLLRLRNFFKNVLGLLGDPHQSSVSTLHTWLFAAEDALLADLDRNQVARCHGGDSMPDNWKTPGSERVASARKALRSLERHAKADFNWIFRERRRVARRRAQADSLPANR